MKKVSFELYLFVSNEFERREQMTEEIKRLNVPISADLHTQLKVTATVQGKTLTQWVLEAVEEKLGKENNQK